MKTHTIGIFALIGSLVLASATLAQNTSTKASEPAANAKPDTAFIDEGIKAIETEFEAFAKDPAVNKLREKPDYFKDAAGKISEEDLLKMLGKRHNRNPALDAYIKWNLLSLHPTPFSEPNVKQAVKLYRSSVLPPARPGTNADQEMQGILRQVTKENYQQVNSQWDIKVAQSDLMAAPFLDYRDDLYSRLPKTAETFRYAFEDAEGRMTRGYDIKYFLIKLLTDVRSVAAGSNPGQIKQLAAMIQYFSNRPVFSTVYVAIGPKDVKDSSSPLVWKTAKRGFSTRDMELLAKDLQDMASVGF